MHPVTHTRACTHTHIHTYIHTHLHTYTHARTHTRTQSSINTTAGSAPEAGGVQPAAPAHPTAAGAVITGIAAEQRGEGAACVFARLVCACARHAATHTNPAQSEFVCGVGGRRGCAQWSAPLMFWKMTLLLSGQKVCMVLKSFQTELPVLLNAFASCIA